MKDLRPSKEAGDAVIKVLNDFTPLGNPERQRAIECQTAKGARGPHSSSHHWTGLGGRSRAQRWAQAYTRLSGNAADESSRATESRESTSKRLV